MTSAQCIIDVLGKEVTSGVHLSMKGEIEGVGCCTARLSCERAGPNEREEERGRYVGSARWRGVARCGEEGRGGVDCGVGRKGKEKGNKPEAIFCL